VSVKPSWQPPSACRSCGASIIWAKTANGGLMPVDVTSVEGGNVDLDRVRTGFARATVVASDAGVFRYVSHFATCPDAAKHRKRA
jgi:hypothetical protein